MSAPREVVAVVLTWRGRVGLFKRSLAVDSDAGLWHCITGHLDGGESPIEGALRELDEETGLRAVDLDRLDSGAVLELHDACGGSWRVHTFQAATERRRLTLNWEHECYRWVAATKLRRFDGQVSWLHDVMCVFGIGGGAPGEAQRENRGTHVRDWTPGGRPGAAGADLALRS